MRSPPLSISMQFLRRNSPKLTALHITSLIVKHPSVLHHGAPLLPRFIGDSVTDLATSLFRYQGPVPLVQAFGINAVLFALLQSKLNTMLTPSGFTSSLILGTGLWASLGWRGWTLCVLYLFLGQAVTKVRFEEKEKRGIAEGRGGRRGPENVWYVHVFNVSPYPYSF